MLLRRKENKTSNSSKKSQLAIIGSLLLIVSGICIVGGKYLYNYCLDKEDDFKIEEFYQEQEQLIIDTEVLEEEIEVQEIQEIPKTETKVEYIAVIKIPKIGLEKGLCKKGSSCNNVDKNIQILNEATYPDVANGNFILAGHSGNGRTAYFKNVNKLTQDDEIIVVYDGFEYKYKIVNIYDIEKTGTATIIRNKEKTTLTLITCRQNTNKQIIVISELIERYEYHG